MSERISSRSQLVASPKASSLPRPSTSAGRQGSNSPLAHQLHLEGQRPGARRRRVDSFAEALQQRRGPRGRGRPPRARRRGGFRASASAGRSAGSPARRPRRAGRASRGGRSPSGRAGPARGRSPPRTRRRPSPASMCGTPQRSRRTRTGPSSPSSSIVPLVWGSGLRRSGARPRRAAAASPLRPRRREIRPALPVPRSSLNLLAGQPVGPTSDDPHLSTPIGVI